MVVTIIHTLRVFQKRKSNAKMYTIFVKAQCIVPTLIYLLFFQKKNNEFTFALLAEFSFLFK